MNTLCLRAGWHLSSIIVLCTHCPINTHAGHQLAVQTSENSRIILHHRDACSLVEKLGSIYARTSRHLVYHHLLFLLPYLSRIVHVILCTVPLANVLHCEAYQSGVQSGCLCISRLITFKPPNLIVVTSYVLSSSGDFIPGNRGFELMISYQ